MAPILTRLGQSFGFGASSGGGAAGPNWDATQEATGGIIALYEDPGSPGTYYKTHSFYTSGAFVTEPTITISAVEFLIVGAGGGGGGGNGATCHGGGGGGGGSVQGTPGCDIVHPGNVVWPTAYPVSANTSYPVVIGAGGYGGNGTGAGQADSGLQGGNTTFGGGIAGGGGYGGGGASPGSGRHGQDMPGPSRASGGGGGASPSPGGGGGAGNYGSAGGNGGSGGNAACGGGGGGAAWPSNGGNGGNYGGNGGSGRTDPDRFIDGTTEYVFGAGGGGGGDDNSQINPVGPSVNPYMVKDYGLQLTNYTTHINNLNPGKIESAGAGGSYDKTGAGGPGGICPGTPTTPGPIGGGDLYNSSGFPGIQGSGGGGGGGHGGYDAASGSGGYGGPGICVIQYQIPKAQAVAHPDGDTYLATGGRRSHSPTKTYHVFANPGTFTIHSPIPAGVDLIIQGAGGGGGIEAGGGGGAGALVEVTGYAVPSPSYTIQVGAGGRGANFPPGYNSSPQLGPLAGRLNCGGESKFGDLIALGGQGGGCGWNSIQTPNSPHGGCGGGSHDNMPPNNPSGSQPTQNPGVANLNQYTNPGGPNPGPTSDYGNGGGGTGSSPVTSPTSPGAGGGIGRQIPADFRPSPLTYEAIGTPGPAGAGYLGGGGAGGTRSGAGDSNPPNGFGGAGGGGRGAGPTSDTGSVAGVVLTGGGGGACHTPYRSGRPGGSGVIIVSYPHSGA